jgi:hypothetical protein
MSLKPVRALRKGSKLACMLAFIVLTPHVARAGDCPIVTYGDWGMGKIDGKILFYFGRDSCLVTPIPAPPEGPRWNVAYRTIPVAEAGTVVSCLLLRRRRSQRHTVGNTLYDGSREP